MRSPQGLERECVKLFLDFGKEVLSPWKHVYPLPLPGLCNSRAAKLRVPCCRGCRALLCLCAVTMQTEKYAILDLEANCFSAGYKPELTGGTLVCYPEMPGSCVRKHRLFLTRIHQFNHSRKPGEQLQLDCGRGLTP